MVPWNWVFCANNKINCRIIFARVGRLHYIVTLCEHITGVDAFILVSLYSNYLLLKINNTPVN